VTFESGINQTGTKVISVSQNQDNTYIYIISMGIMIGSIAAVSGYSCKRGVQKKQGANKLGGF
jgi:hypothetical protein